MRTEKQRPLWEERTAATKEAAPCHAHGTVPQAGFPAEPEPKIFPASRRAALSATLFNNLNKFLDYPSLSPFSLQRATAAASILPPHLDEGEGGGVNCADKIEISAPAAICPMSVFSPRRGTSGSWITRRRREGGKEALDDNMPDTAGCR